MADPTALLATLAGGAVALAAIAALRPRRQRASTQRAEREPMPHMGYGSRREGSAVEGLESTPADGTPVRSNSASAIGHIEESIVREIAHSLNTPLAQIEATILSIEPHSEEQKKINGLLDAVRICKSFLAAFREVATMSGDAEAWEPDSLSGSLMAAANVYGSRVGKEFTLRVNMPDRIPGYDNNYILAIVLPILENAIEAVEPEGPVDVDGRLVPEVNIISVSNGSSISFLPGDIYEPEYTTKPGHSGFGLAVVRRLVAARPDASVQHDVRDGRVICTVNLPRRRQNERRDTDRRR